MVHIGMLAFESCLKDLQLAGRHSRSSLISPARLHGGSIHGERFVEGTRQWS